MHRCRIATLTISVLLPVGAFAANPFLDAPDDKPVSAKFRGTEWSDEVSAGEIPLTARVVTTRVAKMPWGAILKIEFADLKSRSPKKREIRPDYFIVTAITTFLGLAGLYLVRRKYSAEVLKENHEVAAIIFNAFGLFYGVMVAFVVFVTWSGYDEATKNLQLEASEALDLFHSAEAFPDPPKKVIQQGVRDFIADVYIAADL